MPIEKLARVGSCLKWFKISCRSESSNSKPGRLDTLANNVPFIVLQQKLKYNIHEMLKRGVPIKKPI